MPEKVRDETPSDGPSTLERAEEPTMPPLGVPGAAGGRYRVQNMIAKGGMGEVFAAFDEQVGREVAVKRMRETAPTEHAMTRFFREATIQGRLDHPAIVPVHELGVDPDGRPFFVMKKLTGTTLGELISNGLPREALLRAFVDVCLAVEFAHAHGIVHRDLKPANIVLGDYGEVYVLDWGVARLRGVKDRLEPTLAVDASGDGEAVIGTPGYMAPEQAGAASEVDGRADVYALGCILFEILAGDPLHPRGVKAMPSTLGGVDARPSMRGKDAPPELEALCVAATALFPEHRIASARELGQRVQRFLDGDRDLAKRRDLALGHLDAARQAFAQGDSEPTRRTVMREAARALALDPSLPGAAELVTRLMLEPPRVMPPEVQHAIDVDDTVTRHRTARIGAWAYLAFLAGVPVFAGGVDVEYGVALGVVIALNCALLVFFRPFGPMRALAVAAANALLVSFVARVFSPFFIAPGVAAIIVMALMFSPVFADLRAMLVLAMVFTLAVLVPWAGERIGLLSMTTVITNESVTFTGPAQHLGDRASTIGLVFYVMALITAAAGMGHAMRHAERTLRHRLFLQAWQLRQLVPVGSD